MQQIKDLYRKLPPGIRRWTVVTAVGVCVLAVAAVVTQAVENPPPRSQNKEVSRTVLSDNTRSVSMDALNAELRRLREVSENQGRENERLNRRLDEVTQVKSKDAAMEALQQSVAMLQAQLQETENKLRSINVQERAPPPEAPADIGVAAVLPEADAPDDNDSADEPTVESIFRAARPRSPGLAGGPGGGAPAAGSSDVMKPSTGGERAQGVGQGLRIVRMQEKPAQDEVKAAAGKPAQVKDGDVVLIPSGSIISGVLINGLDAPTGQSARRDPFPALLRVKAEAILPNRFRVDVRECFVLVSGYGDLASERAYLRSENISCVRNDGRVLDVRLEGYVTGEDGKAGIRGRLVSKQGQMIANALLAGFMEGASKAFDVRPVPILQTGSGSIGRSQQYQSSMSPEAVQSAAVSGAGSAMERIAQFYISMAEQTTPVVEVDAERNVTLIITRGAKLDFSGSGSGRTSAASDAKAPSQRTSQEDMTALARATVPQATAGTAP